jgi:alkaline phosphatase
MQRIWPLIAFLTVAVSCKTPAPQAFTIPVFEPGKQAKNIILLIGDGMGLGQVSAAMYTNNNRLAMAEFPVVGFHKTYSADQLITDSAAGATAFACGQKTYNGAIGVTNDTLPCFTIMEEARQNGLATGLIATAAIVHATPAAFLAHVDNRISYEDIALDFVNHPADLLIGGGSQYFKSRETDQRDLYSELRKKNYYVSDHSMEDLLRAPFRADQGFAYFTAEGHPGTYAQNRTYLPFATRYGLKYLSQRSAKGFFVMIEGSQIDWKCHSGEGKEAILETLDFDSAVREALEFAKDRDDTLVIVTADHETGGMAIQPGSKMGRLKLDFTTNSHTASMVPVFAFGPSAELFYGIYENTGIYTRMRQALGFSSEGSTAGGNAH